MSYDDNKETDDEVDIEFDEIKTNSTQSPIDDGKMLFVYKSFEMKKMFHRFGNELLLLDATYKTTKYTLPLFFLVVKTNLIFQVCAVIVLQEESTEMIAKALNTMKMWNPEVLPNYAFVDFDEREIVLLESTYPNIEVYLCDSHRERLGIDG